MTTSNVLFFATDPTDGRELWVTDGVFNISLVKDINPGSASSASGGGDLAALGNGKVLFAATDGTHGTELWVTDGTAAGTELVKDINTGSGSSLSNSADITALGNGKALFSANDGTHGYELWVTDGTAAGTSLVKDLSPYSGYEVPYIGSNSFPHSITALGNGKALFSAYDGGYVGLWVTDGTYGGTTEVARQTNATDVTVLGNGKAVFSSYGLWVTDGMSGPGHTYQLPSGSNPLYITALGNGTALFAGSGRALWVTDGTSAGTSLVKDINPGSPNDIVGGITALGNGKALFAGYGGFTYGVELWVTDGTAAGTVLLKDIAPASSSSGPANITAIGNGKAVFVAGDDTHGRELWVTDGTAAGTYQVRDINPGGPSSDSWPQSITAIGNGRALFSATDGTHGYELWVTNGTAAGTYLAKDINTNAASSNPSAFALLCFAPGISIRTPSGEAAVETLRRGDLVLVTDGRALPVTWIGRQTVSTKFGDPLRVFPIRIRAGALAENVPCRDLLVTPDHAVLVGDVLVQAGALVNGLSIVRERNVPERFTYYHVELDDHSLLLAENTPAETFVDNVDRLAFDNWAEHEALYPNGKPIVEMRYPRAKASRQVPTRIKLRLEARAARLYEAIRAVA